MARITAPVLASGAAHVRAAFALAIIIIKIIIRSAGLGNANACAIDVIPDVGFLAFLRERAADAIVAIGRCIISVWRGVVDETRAIEVFVVSTGGVWPVAPAR